MYQNRTYCLAPGLREAFESTTESHAKATGNAALHQPQPQKIVGQQLLEVVSPNYCT